MGSNVAAEAEYLLLKDLKLEIDCDDGAFTLCFWLFLSSPISFPFTILRRFCPDTTDSTPFLALNEKKILTLSPSLFLHKDSTEEEVPYVSAKKVFPMGKWVHVGCEVTADFLRLYNDGEIVGEKPLNFSLGTDGNSDSLQKMSLSASNGDDIRSKGYVQSIEVLPPTSSIKDHLTKKPPQQLLIDCSSASEIEEEDDGIWNIVGGKASCRRNFSLDVVLLDPFGNLVSKEMEVFASLLYADNGAPVQRPSDAEAPLLTSHDGIEFASFDRPSKLINGRASFKLKISQLSSKCDNRLFLIRFDIPGMGEYPFFEACSRPIRCISRGRNTRSPLMCRRPTSTTHLLNGAQPSRFDDGSSDILHNIVHEAKPSPSSKRVKLGQGNSLATLKAGLTLDRADEECNSHAWTAKENDNTYGNSLEKRREKDEETGKSTSDSESIGARNSDFKSVSTSSSAISDLAIFKYCLGGLNERALMLKDIAILASERQLVDFAHQVSLYSGCSHHEHQIIMSKRLVEEGTKAWDLIAQSNSHVHWENVESEIKKRFMMISSSSRSLTQQDLELLRRIAGCHELVARENFEKMWCWLYPIAFTLSRDWANALWNSTSMKWIEGLITKEEAESSLQGPWGLKDPGTFVLRFPTSRSWPHPDAGNLVVTYVGGDYTIHQRLLSLDLFYRCSEKEGPARSLQDMLLEEPELLRLGRVIRT